MHVNINITNITITNIIIVVVVIIITITHSSSPLLFITIITLPPSKPAALRCLPSRWLPTQALWLSCPVQVVLRCGSHILQRSIPQRGHCERMACLRLPLQKAGFELETMWLEIHPSNHKPRFTRWEAPLRHEIQETQCGWCPISLKFTYASIFLILSWILCSTTLPLRPRPIRNPQPLPGWVISSRSSHQLSTIPPARNADVYELGGSNGPQIVSQVPGINSHPTKFQQNVCVHPSILGEPMIFVGQIKNKGFL